MREFAKGKCNNPRRERSQNIPDRIGDALNAGRGRYQDRSKGGKVARAEKAMAEATTATSPDSSFPEHLWRTVGVYPWTPTPVDPTLARATCAERSRRRLNAFRAQAQ
jgi:hypothetical protein